MKLSTLLGDYPQTHLVRAGERRATSFEFDFADVKVPNRGFKRTVRDLEFDASELALVTFLQARAYGKPLVALPITIVGRAQHQCIVYNSDQGILDPAALAGKRIGARAYAQTTVTWVRGMLVEEYGLDVSQAQWITFEDGHLSEYPDPAWCERAAEGKDIMGMLGAGEIDAAIVGNEKLTDPRFKTLIPDPVAAHEAWCARHQAVPVNHLMVVKASLSQSHPEIVRDLFNLLVVARAAVPAPAGRDLLPVGIEALRPSLAMAIDYADRQGLLPRPLTVDELFDDFTRALKP